MEAYRTYSYHFIINLLPLTILYLCRISSLTFALCLLTSTGLQINFFDRCFTNFQLEITGILLIGKKYALTSFNRHCYVMYTVLDYGIV